MTVVLEGHQKYDGNEIMVRRHDHEGFIRLDVDVVYNWGPLERRITPTEARQLAAALVALAGQIDGDDDCADLSELIAKARKWDIINEIATGKGIDPYELPGHIETAEQWYRWRHEAVEPAVAAAEIDGQQ